MNTVINSQKLSKPIDTGNNSGAFRFMSFMLLCLVALCLSITAYAQKAVSGKVTDATDNSGLPGVSVSVKGTTTGTVTDASGSYNLNVPGDNVTLVFSFVGYISQEVAVAGRSSINVALAADVQALQEVVVIGYGTQQKKDVTGGVVALTPKEFNQGQIASPEQLLQGRAAGIQITPSSGDPGAAQAVRIRGAFSLTGSANPLYVVDGVPLSGDAAGDGSADFGLGSSSARNPLTFLNPADIENITVLKDASASAIYGSRGANGVILITTRRGKAGQQSLNFSMSAGTSSTLKRYDLVPSSDYIGALTRAGAANPNDPTVNAGSSTNWQNEIFRTAPQQNYNLNYGGGNDNTSYFVSLGYSDIQGIVKNSGLTRLSGRINASHELLNDKIKLDLQLSTTRTNDQFPATSDNAGYQGSLLGAALSANPTYPVYDAQGRYFTPSGYDANGNVRGGDFRNPAALLNGVIGRGNTNTTVANIGATWRIWQGLSYKLNFGVINTEAQRRASIDANLPGFGGATPNNINAQKGIGALNNRSTNSWLVEHTLSYNEKVGVGQLDALLGFSYQKFANVGYFTQTGNFFPGTNQSILDNIGAVDASQLGVTAFFASQNGSKYDIQSFFGRVGYNINEKYLLTATLRVDGSSKFGPNNKYGYFPSVAAAWRLSQEGFMANNGIFDDLKLRLNWGITGGQNALPPGATIQSYVYEPFNGIIRPNNNPNPNLKWELTNMYGAGLDFSVRNGKLSGTLDYFNRSVSDAIFYKYYGASAAIPYQYVNLPGKIKSQGIEFTLNYKAVQTDDFTYEAAFNTTYLQTKISGFDTTGTTYQTGSISGQGLTGQFSQTFKDGASAYAFFLPVTSGFNGQGFSVYPTAADENNTDPAKAQRQIIGSALPKFTFGFNNSFTYKRFSLNLFFSASTGFYVYNNTANALFYKAALKNGRNVTTDVANSTENGTNFAAVSTRFLEKGNFLRLSNANIGYAFPMKENSAIKSLRISLTGQNLFLITNYSGLDPEVSTNKSINNIASQGIDYTAIPNPRTFLIGVSAGF